MSRDSVSLLLQAATNPDSPGPLQMSAMALEITSLSFLFVVLLQESDSNFEEQMDKEDACPIDLDEIVGDEEQMAKLSSKELTKLETCVELEEEEIMRQRDRSTPHNGEGEAEETLRRIDDAMDTSVNIV